MNGFLTPARRALIRDLYGTRAAAVEALLAGFKMPVGQSDPVLDLLFKNTCSLRQEVIDFLTRSRDVPVAALAHDGDGKGMPLCEAQVVIDNRGQFEFSTAGLGGDAVRAIVVVARSEEGEPVDLVAWTPRGNVVATYWGRAVILGAHALEHVELGGAVTVHRDVTEWLSAGRNGIVILDRKRAWRLLLEAHVVVAGVEHGDELQKTLRPPMAKISVRVPACGA